MKYVVVCCSNRVIYNAGVTEDSLEATKIMANNFFRDLYDFHVDVESIEQMKAEYESGEYIEERDYALLKADAWINHKDSEIDYQILEIS